MRLGIKNEQVHFILLSAFTIFAKGMRKILYSLVANGELYTEGAKTNRRYSLN